MSSSRDASRASREELLKMEENSSAMFQSDMAKMKEEMAKLKENGGLLLDQYGVLRMGPAVAATLIVIIVVLLSIYETGYWQKFQDVIVVDAAIITILLALMLPVYVQVMQNAHDMKFQVHFHINSLMHRMEDIVKNGLHLAVTDMKAEVTYVKTEVIGEITKLRQEVKTDIEDMKKDVESLPTKVAHEFAGETGKLMNHSKELFEHYSGSGKKKFF
eukprot:TRINITY_DN26417_c0_g1_i1.p1 TRINITY_DN26417_c0_g1~~TRINITY_DN26417_c0_g1_i1.p1  ORF type:complete len:217 (+),score=49.30 TRINITY_DN26417_c0_g1_i1:70-720(+)